jgi:hypothetical protein
LKVNNGGRNTWVYALSVQVLVHHLYAGIREVFCYNPGWY